MILLQIVDEDDIRHADSLLHAKFERGISDLSHMTWEQRVHSVMGDLLHVGIKVAVAVAIFIVGRWLIKRLVNLMGRMFERWKVDHALRTFVRTALKTVLYFVLAYVMIAWLGINTSLFVALFAAAGLAIGMAMSGVFQNLAGGIIVLMLRPFRCGDWIEAQDFTGRVMDIRLFNTVIRTADNRTVMLPNAGLATGVVVNHFWARTRRLEWVVELDLGVDFDAVSKLLREILAADERVNSHPATEVLLSKIDDNSINLLIHGWVASQDYWSVLYDIYARIYTTLPAHGFDLSSGKSIDVNLTNVSQAGAGGAGGSESAKADKGLAK